MSEQLDNPAPAPSDTPSTPPVADPAPAPQADPSPAKDWREEWSAGDEKMRNMLNRYNSQADIAKALFETKRQIDSGVYKKAVPFPADASDEVKAQWRKENGIPTQHTEYKLPEGLVIGDADKPTIENFLKTMHDQNVPDGVPQAAVDWYFKAQEERAAKEVEESRKFKQETEEVLRQRWGSEYLANYRMAEAFAIEKFGEHVGQALLSAGPEAVEAIASISRDINPAATIAPHSNNPAASIADEKAQLEMKMKNLDSWKNDKKGQARYQEILAYERRVAQR